MAQRYCEALNKKDLVAIAKMREGFREDDPTVEKLKLATNWVSSLPSCKSIGSSVSSDLFCHISFILEEPSSDKQVEGTIYALPQGVFRYAEGWSTHEARGLGWLIAMLTLEDSLMRKGIIIKLQNMGLPIEEDLETADSNYRIKSARELIEYLGKVDNLTDDLTPPAKMSVNDLNKFKATFKKDFDSGLNHANELNERQK